MLEGRLDNGPDIRRPEYQKYRYIETVFAITVEQCVDAAGTEHYLRMLTSAKHSSSSGTETATATRDMHKGHRL